MTAPTVGLRVGVDAAAGGGGSAQRGIGTYTTQLMRGLTASSDIEVTALVPAGVDVFGRAETRRVRRVAHHRIGPWVERLSAPLDLRGLDVDVFWSPSNAVWRSRRTPVVQTILDLTPLVFTHPLLAVDARRWRARAAVVRKAAAIIAISRSSADQAIRHLGVEAARVTVVGLGVDPAFRPNDPTRPTMSPTPTSSAAPPYLLMVTAWGPHKGFREAAAVFDGLVDAGCDLRLRIVGPVDGWMLARIEEDLSQSRHRDRIDVLGWVADLPETYRGAEALIVTSRAEGFGLPAAEALCCGTPVVAFDNTSLPEVIGDDGVLVPDGNVAAMTAEVLGVLRTGRGEFLDRAPSVAARMRWADSIEGHAAVLHSAVLHPAVLHPGAGGRATVGRAGAHG